MSHRVLASVAPILLGLAIAPSAFGAPDVAGSTLLNEPNGFPPACNQPCFIAQKDFEVFLDGNATGPGVCPAGTNTYLYTITHTGGSGPFVPALTQFEISVAAAAANVASAGFIPGVLDPSATTIDTGNDVVTWDFQAPTIASGLTSSQLFVCSALVPGSISDNMASVDGQASLDAPGECVGPFGAPGGEPNPCTIGFWKNRAAGKNGLLQFFPGTDLDDVVAAALALSGGLFATADLNASCNPTDFDDLICALKSKGKRSIEERARQQAAATLLNLAAGDLFPDNGKCQLFESNSITSNACGDNLSVGDAVATSKAGIGGDESAQHDAQECFDDINNGIGVVE